MYMYISVYVNSLVKKSTNTVRMSSYIMTVVMSSESSPVGSYIQLYMLTTTYMIPARG